MKAEGRFFQAHPWALLGGAFAIVALWGAILLALAQIERLETANLERNLNNLALSFAGHVERSLHDIDQMLLTMGWLAARDDRKALGDLMRRRMAEDPMFVILAVSDAQGDVVLSQPTGPAANLADREHVAVHRGRDDLGLYCGKPVIGRISNRLSIQFTRRLPVDGGPFAGVLTAGVDPDYFIRYYAQFALGEGGMISLVGLDGVVRARFVEGAAGHSGVGVDVSDSAVFAAARQKTADLLRVPSNVDGRRRVYAVRRLNGYPLYVVVGMAEEVALADVHQQRRTFLTIGAAASLTLAVLTMILARQSTRLRRAWTQQRRTVAELKLASKVFEECANGIVITDAANRILMINRAFTGITGYALEEVIGKDPGDFGSDRTPAEQHREMWRALGEQGYWCGEIVNCRKDGSEYPIWLSVSAIHDGEGTLTNYVALFSHSDVHKFDAGSLHFLVHYDLLTELPNRLLLSERLGQALGAAARLNHRLAVMFIDLDFFKPVNDVYGHDAGDEVLRQVGRRLRAVLRQSDTLARYGGDEFVLVAPEVGTAAQAEEIAQRCREACAQPFLVGQNRISISASIGIALFPEDGADEAALIAAADAAMYRSKRDTRPGEVGQA